MLQIQRILVPLDFSDAGDQALRVAHSLARDHHAKLILLTAAAPPPPVGELYVPFGDFEGIAEESRRRLSLVAARITDVPVETQVAIGVPGPTIVYEARAVQANLIVMSTHGRTGLSRVLMGSAAEYVLRHAPCPVLTIKPDTVQHLSHEEETALATPRAALGDV